jgi:hypothetical protein
MLLMETIKLNIRRNHQEVIKKINGQITVDRLAIYLLYTFSLILLSVFDFVFLFWRREIDEYFNKKDCSYYS